MTKSDLRRDDRLHDAKKSDRNPGDKRSEFQRDRDRVLYCTAFRRLAGITQVANAAEGHIFHNRLTHSLKVAQVARRLAEDLLRVAEEQHQEERVEALGGLDPDVAECAGLAHDLGLPPFGHIAEQEIQSVLGTTKTKHDSSSDGFEGNVQTFRIVTKLGIRTSGSSDTVQPDPVWNNDGLDLTRATLNAIIKYPWAREVGDGRRSRKWGYYRSERREFEFARAMMSSRGDHRSLEAAIMDWADDVTYAVHDVDDCYRAGLVPLDQLLRGDTYERRRFVAWAAGHDSENKAKKARTNDEYDRVLKEERGKEETKRERFVGRLMTGANRGTGIARTFQRLGLSAWGPPQVLWSTDRPLPLRNRNGGGRFARRTRGRGTPEDRSVCT